MNGQGWSLVTFASAAVTGALLATTPVITTSTCTMTPSGPPDCTSARSSLLASEGAGVLLALAVPALVALAPLILRSKRAAVAAAAAITLGTLVALASVGIFFIPTVVLAWVAAGASRLDDGHGGKRRR